MKRIWLLVLFCLMTSFAFADVTAEIVGKTLDDNGAITIRTQYKVDGVEVVSRYPQDAQGRYYWQTRYNAENFAGMNKTQTIQIIKKDIKGFSEHLIIKKYRELANDVLINGTNFNNTIGQTLATSSTKIILDVDKDGTPETQWEIFTNGTRIETAYP